MPALATDNLRDLLSALEDTHEVVLRYPGDDPVRCVWRSAAVDARDAYEAWCAAPGPLTHAAYIAAEERADAALEALMISQLVPSAGPHDPLPLAA